MQATLLAFIVSVYFGLLFVIAFLTARHSNNESFFVGNRNSRWWLVAFGMIGTSLSGMTFISVPGKVGMSGFDYYQVVIGYWIGYFIVAFILLPIYYRLQVTSIYSYLETRLGIVCYKTGALFFILSRTLGATLRLYLVIKVLERFILTDLHISFEYSAVIILALILLYTFKGGVKTIVWTDTLQTTFMLIALLVCVIYILNNLGLNIDSAWEKMAEHGYTKLISNDLKSPGFFLKQILGGALITVGMTGLDQEMMQKNISVRTLSGSQKNMITFSFSLLAANFIFLFLGGVLYLFAEHYGISAIKDDLFPTIAIKSGLPFLITVCFVIGIISALFPSADGALTALTSSFCIDIIGIKKRQWDEIKKRNIRLIVHIVMAFIFLLCIFFFRAIDSGSLIDLLLEIAGYTYGPLLALFFFGIFTKRRLREWLVPFACVSGPILCYTLKSHQSYFLGDYAIGNELLALNGIITFILLFTISRKNMEPNGTNYRLIK